jgi:hypothetical protein
VTSNTNSIYTKLFFQYKPPKFTHFARITVI